MTVFQLLLFNVTSSLSRHYVNRDVGLHVRCRTFIIRVSKVLPDLVASISVNCALCTGQVNLCDVAPFIAITDITVNWLSQSVIHQNHGCQMWADFSSPKPWTCAVLLSGFGSAE